MDEAVSPDGILLIVRVIDTDDLLVFSVIEPFHARHLFDQVNVLILGGFLQVVGKHEMHLVVLVHEVLLVNVRPLVVLGQVVQCDCVDENLWIQELVEALLKLEYLYVLT